MRFSWYGIQATVNVVAIMMHILVTLRVACCWADEPEPAEGTTCSQNAGKITYFLVFAIFLWE